MANSPQDSSSQDDSPVDTRSGSDGQHNRFSSRVTTPATEGYPSWLPRRAPAPEPASTMHSSSAGLPTPDVPAPVPVAWGGRKPTPRSMRVVRMSSTDNGGRRIPTDTTRVSHPMHARAWSRATSHGVSPTLFSLTPSPHVPRPRFRSPALNLDLLRNPSVLSRLYFLLFPIVVFAHIPLQTFFDFNAVFILIQVSRFPNPVAPGVSGSGRNWALGAAAYVACWAIWVFVVVIVYELVYSFIRRWRVKRPLMLPLYLSSPAFNLVCMTSYTNFSFFHQLRTAAFCESTGGSLRDGLAETFYWYSQNLPTVALLIPRAGLCLALLLSYGTAPLPGNLSAQNAGVDDRDSTYFRANGTLTDFARGVLIANAAWTAWRVLVLLGSWIGLWILSGQGCAGLCGPRYRWQEDEAEKATSVYSDDGLTDPDALVWSWKESCAERVQEAWECCLTTRARSRLGRDKDPSGTIPPVRDSGPAFEGMEKVLAAIGLGGPQTPHAARRGVLSEDLFEGPGPEPEPLTRGLGEIIPSPEIEEVRRQEEAAQEGGKDAPLRKLPYPFPGYGSQDSHEGRIPFPPSPVPPEETAEGGEEGEEGDEFEEEEEDYVHEADESEEPSSEAKGRSSGSMSSLGRPIASRYPFQFRKPTNTTATHQSFSTVGTHRTPPSKSSNSRSTPSTRGSALSHPSVSTGHHPSSGESPYGYASSSGAGSPTGASSMSGRVPMPPRAGGLQGRARSGTVPAASASVYSSPSSPSPAGGRPRARTGTGMATESGESLASQTFGPIPLQVYEPDDDDELDETMEMMEQPEAEGPQEAAEIEDEVGLLSTGPSPRSSRSRLRSRGSRASGTSTSRSRTDSQGRIRTRTMSGSGSASGSGSSSARSRAQSLIQSIGAASRSSLELVTSAVRSRTESMARLSDEPHLSNGSDAGHQASSPENHTFGHPLREQWRQEDAGTVTRVSEGDEEQEEEHDAGAEPELRAQQSFFTVSAPSQTTFMQHPEPAGIPIPGAPMRDVPSHANLSTAPASFVTGPATTEGSSDTPEGASTWGAESRFFEGGPAHARGHGGQWHGPA